MAKKDKIEKVTEEKNTSNESGQEEVIPEEILEAIPEEDRGRVSSIIRQTMISGVMRGNNPIADKITSDHITDLIKKSDDHDVRDRQERQGERNYNLILIIIGLVFIGFLIVFLQSNENLLIKIVIGIISFIGGLGFGKTIKSTKE